MAKVKTPGATIIEAKTVVIDCPRSTLGVKRASTRLKAMAVEANTVKIKVPFMMKTAEAEVKIAEATTKVKVKVPFMTKTAEVHTAETMTVTKVKLIMIKVTLKAIEKKLTTPMKGATKASTRLKAL